MYTQSKRSEGKNFSSLLDLNINVIIGIIHERGQMFRLHQHRIEIGIGQAQPKFDVLHGRPVHAGFEFRPGLLHHESAPVRCWHPLRSPKQLPVQRQCPPTRGRGWTHNRSCCCYSRACHHDCVCCCIVVKLPAVSNTVLFNSSLYCPQIVRVYMSLLAQLK
jgi:hypothetical protein